MNNDSDTDTEHLFNTDFDYENAFHSEQDNFINNNANLYLSLAMWAFRCCIFNKALTVLLTNLKTFSNFSPENLPKDVCTLLKIPTSPTIQNMCGGTYYHLSIKFEVELIYQNDIEIEVLSAHLHCYKL